MNARPYLKKGCFVTEYRKLDKRFKAFRRNIFLGRFFCVEEKGEGIKIYVDPAICEREEDYTGVSLTA